MKEQWRAVPDHKGFYEVSNMGRVRSLARLTKTGWRGGKMLKLRPTKRTGYLQVTLSLHGVASMRYVHALVLEAFVGPRPKNCDACHAPDPNPKNCRVNNLRWGTRQQNHHDKIAHGTQTRGDNHPVSILRENDIHRIFLMRKAGVTQTKIASVFGTTASNIYRILHRKTWAHVEVLP